ncbi:hypothetical protein AEAC466_04560 [Asticcacaulis sp. AC466]|uniref:DUF1653 domain-containing protein n=1 Tax=Asticcacaulis sp. AC466 TaxID=1282362 RepID=UPI0003C3E8CC|nr:hypothetical protein AEAC466_04560 [Asticcacaulis sp. AC466]
MFEIEPGQVYRHHSGRVYTVLYLANASVISDRFPITVVYIGANGNVWSRPLAQFLEKFELLHDGKSTV